VAKDAATNAMLAYNASAWAGSRSLVVNLITPGNGGGRSESVATLLRETNVTATLFNDVTVQASKVTSNGTAFFTNLPLSQTILLNAVTSSNNSTSPLKKTDDRFPTRVLAGIQSSATLFLFVPPPPLQNQTR
jgi:hypothetical protein